MIKNKLILLFIASQLLAMQSFAQSVYWQQKADYKIDVELDHKNHQYKGKETIVYSNNSPDVLTHLFFHLYFNAFQPGSTMDIRSRTIADPDARVSDRIFNLKKDEYGYLNITSLKIDGRPQKYFQNETILELKLDKNIAAGAKVNIELEFEGQVPVQIRRSGRNSSEGIDYSMSQWYPKLCEYDYMGWHANPYVGREFYGIWGDFDVNISLDKKYIVGATGVLQNPLEIGHGYAPEGSKLKQPAGDKLTWKFKAQNVHDFVWGADPDYTHDQVQVPGGPTLHFLYQKNMDYSNTWKDAQPLVVKGFEFLSKNFGVYPYPQYSIIQGGDGGMEYPMATLITGNRKLPSLVGVTIHEAAHSWYHGVLATNESLYPWMDEGFTSFATDETMSHLFKSGMPSYHQNAYNGYFDIVREGKEESLDTHADHYETNYAYGTASYNKGEVYLAQLEYVMGPTNFRAGLIAYFNTWKFKHPTAIDFIRVMEKQSGLELDWYHEYFGQTTKTIDYGIAQISGGASSTEVTLVKKGKMPMPIDLEVKYKDGTYETFYIPLDIMRGSKPADGYNGKWTVLEDWQWVKPSYQVKISKPSSEIESITIDPSDLLADVDRNNNSISPDKSLNFFWSAE